MLSVIDLAVKIFVNIFGEGALFYLIGQVRLWYFTVLSAELQKRLDEDFEMKMKDWENFKNDRPG